MADVKFVKYCQSCGSEQVYKDKRNLHKAISKNANCRRCVNKIVNTKGSYKEIPVSWLEVKRRKAILKGKEFTITIQDVWKAYILQGKKCALSGIPLDFNKDTETSMVSIDRRDNNKGYIKKNIQLVDKRINFMKYTSSQDDFIRLCQLVTEYQQIKSNEKDSKVLRNPSRSKS